MVRCVPSLATLLALAAALSPALAQVRLTPGVVIDRKVVTKVSVTLFDDDSPYAPVAGYKLAFFRSATDSVVAKTDAAGMATALLPAGDYRLVSLAPVEWKGVRYRWSVPIQVRPGMRLIELTRETATTGDSAVMPVATHSASGALGEPSSRRVQRPSGGARPAGYKDPTTATLFSVFLTGGGQLYAGETAKGLGLMLGAIGAVALGAATSEGPSCNDFTFTCSDGDTAPLIAGAAMAVGLWIVGMLDAGPAARRANARHGLQGASRWPVAPVLATGSEGRTGLGLRVQLR